MADNIDQTMSLKAALKDEVSPSLQKINQGAKTTQQALNELGEKTRATGASMGSNMGEAAAKNNQAAAQIQGELKKTGGAFQDLGREAGTSSKNVGAALQNAFAAGKQAQTADDLDDQLGGLKSTLQGMASTNRPLSAKSKNMKALGEDTLNRKVIPAFQALHDTLDDYPSSLGDINSAQRTHIGLSEKMARSLDAVNKRVSGLGKAFDSIKNSAVDLVGAVTTSWFGTQGMKVREHQTTAARQRGVKSFAAAEKVVPEIQRRTQAPDSEWGGAFNAMLDTSREAMESFPRIIEHMVDLAKATGLSSEAFADLFVQMKEISGLTGDKWLDISKKINKFASMSRASIDDIYNALRGATDQMVNFSREARKAYAESSMAGAAASANAGLGSGFAADFFEQMKDIGSKQYMQGLINSYGTTKADLGQMQQEGDVAGTYGAGAEALVKFARQIEQTTGSILTTGTALQAWQQTAEAKTGVSAAQAKKLMAREEELNAIGSSLVGEAERLKAAGKEVNFETLTGTIRNTAGEKAERIQAMANSAAMSIGVHTVKAIEQGMDPLLAMTGGIVDKLASMPDMTRKGIAFFSIGINVMSALRPMLRGMGMGAIADAISGPLETLVGAAIVGTGVKKLGEQSYEAQAEKMFPGQPEMQMAAVKQMIEQGNAQIKDVIGDSRGYGVRSRDGGLKRDSSWANANDIYMDAVSKQGLKYDQARMAAIDAAKGTDSRKQLETRNAFIQEGIAKTQQLQVLTGNDAVLRAKYFQDHRAEMEKKSASLAGPAFFDQLRNQISAVTGGITAPSQNQIQYKIMQDALDQSPAELANNQNLNSIVSDQDIAGVKQQLTNELATTQQRITDVMGQISTDIPEAQLRKSGELNELQRVNNDLILTLIQVVRDGGKSSEDTDRIIAALQGRMKDVPDLSSSEGIDTEIVGRYASLGYGRGGA